jgi:hypothetical protein
MKSQHARAYALTVGIILLGLSFANTARADTEQVTRQYFAGGGAALCSLSPTFCPDVAKAGNGDTITVSGSGTLTPGDKEVSGGGTFVHKNSAGVVLASGTWSAEELVSWKSFGLAGAGFPSGFEGGVAVLQVHLTPSAGGDHDGAVHSQAAPSSEGARHEGGLNAILTITCLLGTPVPGAGEEGFTLAVTGGPNFSQSVSGNTLFIATPED